MRLEIIFAVGGEVAANFVIVAEEFLSLHLAFDVTVEVVLGILCCASK